MQQWMKLACVFFAVLGFFDARDAAADPPATAVWQSSIAPWQTLSVDFDSAVHMGRILAVAVPGSGLPLEGALFLMASDNGGLSRSLNSGDIWENVIGGRGFSNDLCGGYTEEAIPGCKSLPQATLYGGPPGAMPNYVGKDSNVLDAAAGPWPDLNTEMWPWLWSLGTWFAPNVFIGPDGSPSAANALVYEAAHHLYVSPDAARQWFPLAPQCNMADDPYLGTVAVDQGWPGHVVVAKGHVVSNDGQDVGGCNLPGESAPHGRDCMRRTVAWIEDVGPQVLASLRASESPTASKMALRAVERAGGGGAGCGTACVDCKSCLAASTGTGGAQCPTCVDCADCASAVASAPKWRFASVTHLAAGPTCEVVIESTCKVATDNAQVPCHGHKPSEVQPPVALNATANPVDGDVDAWCPAYGAFDPKQSITLQDCTCQATGDCQFPDIRDLEIDPRNGFVYAATTNAGLLLSRDYGAHWERTNKSEAWLGAAKGQSANTTYTGAWNATGVENHPIYANGASAGVRLLTRQHQGSGPAIDLNEHPEWIDDNGLGAMSMSWHPCGDNSTYSGNDARGHARKRGRLVATVPISWRDGQGKRASSVFMAVEDDCGGGAKPLPGPLVFRDTSSLLPGSGAILGVDTMWTGDAMADLSAPPLKLPRQVPAPAAYVTDNATPTCTGACGGRPTCRGFKRSFACGPIDVWN